MPRRPRSLLLALPCSLLAASLGRAKTRVFSVRGGSVGASSAMSAARQVQTTTDNDEALGRILSAVRALGLSPEVEQVQSYYWWKEQVQCNAESRISFASTLPLEEVVAAISSVHNYETPMIISESDAESPYWKGVIPGGTAAMAAELTEARLVACAQLKLVDAQQTSLSVKTVARAKALVESRLSHPVHWKPIVGNQVYLDWIAAETSLTAS
ncbi:hypothetical protein T492DRAFT_979519 [Pavlovales sp. CCMP2436]|nr:hypothetical protein T492DRAFT_979519 [Pavlovales sp. CCMP2436]